MYQSLQTITLKTGESAELGVLSGPDNSELARELMALLGHKGEIWRWQIYQSLTQQHAEVDSRFYILSKAGRPFANIMSVEAHGVGIFGHVYTAPDERRKGAADIIQTFQLDDFKRRGGRALYLGTDYDTHPYRLYRKHGFQGAEHGSNYMYWFALGQERFEGDAFEISPTRHEALSFKHWPVLPALAMMKHPARIRILGMNVIGPHSTEAGALPFFAAVDKHDKGASAYVAVSEKSNLPVAIACVRPEHYFWEQSDLVDLFCAPDFESELPGLLAHLRLPPGRNLVCYADTFWAAKRQILQNCGFSLSATLKNHMLSAGKAHDVELWSRRM